MHTDIDGKWNRLITLDTIRVSGVPDAGGSGVTEWLVAGPLRVLEMRNPNEGTGWDHKKKSRYQYVATVAGILERRLPPEGNDIWRGETSPPAFTLCDPSDYIVALLRQ